MSDHPTPPRLPLYSHDLIEEWKQLTETQRIGLMVEHLPMEKALVAEVRILTNNRARTESTCLGLRNLWRRKVAGNREPIAGLDAGQSA